MVPNGVRSSSRRHSAVGNGQGPQSQGQHSPHSPHTRVPHSKGDHGPHSPPQFGTAGKFDVQQGGQQGGQGGQQGGQGGPQGDQSGDSKPAMAADFLWLDWIRSSNKPQ